MHKIAVLFVCLGNICRSPSAEGVFQHLINQQNLTDQIKIDSAGTGDWHLDHPPYPRAQTSAAERGIDISHLRARLVTPQDFEDFDYVIAMDHSNRKDLAAMGGAQNKQKIYMFLSFAGNDAPEEVPDPYYGGDGSFTYALDLIQEASEGLLRHIQKEHSIA